MNELGYNAGIGTITLYVAGVNECSRKKWANVNSNGRPDAFIETRLQVDGNVICTDKVKYLVVHVPAFFHRLQFNKTGFPNLPSQDLRCLQAAKGVYGTNNLPEDLPQFCLERLFQQQMVDLGLPPNVAALLTQAGQNPTGFKAAMYRDYIAQTNNISRYIVAFAGTDINGAPWNWDWSDIIENFWQGIGHTVYLDQYIKAMEIAYEISKIQGTGITFHGKKVAPPVKGDQTLDFIFTGHSLGGGLASAASVVANRTAVTFNAAGLHKNTLYKRVNGVLTNDERYPGSVTRFNTNGSNLITAYYVDHDILTQIQKTTNPLISKAIGNSVKLDGDQDTTAILGHSVMALALLTSGKPMLAIALGLAATALKTHAAYKCHGIDRLLYGFLVKEGTFGSIEENLLKDPPIFPLW